MQKLCIFIVMDAKEYKQQWYQANKDKVKAKVRRYKQDNAEQVKSTNQAYRDAHKDDVKQWRDANKVHIKQYKKRYKAEHKTQRNAVQTARKQADPLFKLAYQIRSMIATKIKRRGYTKNSRTYQILGCTFEELKQHIEQQFQPWMNWDNYGNWNGVPTTTGMAWDIDHIVPLDSATSEADIIQLNHYSNLQPLDSYINRNVKRATSSQIYP